MNLAVSAFEHDVLMVYTSYSQYDLITLTKAYKLVDSFDTLLKVIGLSIEYNTDILEVAKEYKK